MSVCYAAACALLVLTGVSRAQSSEPRDAWLMQNYRFTGPPPATGITAVDPVVSELREIQNTLLAILRKANFAGDYEAALAAASQAAANVQLIGTLTGHLAPPKAGKPASDEIKPEPSIYLIAFKDQTIHAATSYWAGGIMLHYMTLQGAHEQVRLDLVDYSLSSELNRQRKLAFRLPEPEDRTAHP